MTRLHEGLDYLLYRIYIWGGIAAQVVYFFWLAFNVDGSDPRLVVRAATPTTLWILGILAYWWWVLLFKGNRELEEFARHESKHAPDTSALKSWSSLQQAMALYGGDAEEMIRAANAARRPVLIWYGLQNLLVLWILGGFWVLVPRGSPPDGMRIWILGVFAIMLLFVITPFLVGRAKEEGEAAYLAPLGLSTTASPLASPPRMLEGAAVIEGTRHGRRVRIEGRGKQSATWVQAESPPFQIHSLDGKLVAEEGAPRAVTAALRGLRKAKRWRGIEVTGGPEGIAVRRESPGENMWLYDLWLLERLLEDGWLP
jgi:hypothetical protein